MNLLEQEELAAENDGYSNDYQRALAVSSMRRSPDHRAEANRLVASGLFVAMSFRCDYCPITDGIMGESGFILGTGATREEASAILEAHSEEFQDGDSRSEIWPLEVVLVSHDSGTDEEQVPF